MSKMRYKNQNLTNFGSSFVMKASCYRPDTEAELSDLVLKLGEKNLPFLPRGQGLSYGDSAFSPEGFIIDTRRLNHFLSFDAETGVLNCQGGVSFEDLFSVHEAFIPPVIPGTLKATLAASVANDVHGKNNSQAGCLGQHLVSLELQTATQSLTLDQKTHPDLFNASIGGLGLTGIIKRVSLKLIKASRMLRVETRKFQVWDKLLVEMKEASSHYAYQVAWLDLLNQPAALLSLANHCDSQSYQGERKLPLAIACHLPLVYAWNLRLFNRYYFQRASLKPRIESLIDFNNPLDKIKNWQYLYGKRGLIQSQALFSAEKGLECLDAILSLIKKHRATPSLAVLKYFNQSGLGLLSFVKPGFSLAIDFIHNAEARAAISAINAYLSQGHGRIYLAKDLLLTPEEFSRQYPQHEAFKRVLKAYPAGIESCLSQRLGLT